MATEKTNLARVIPFPLDPNQPSQRPWLDNLATPHWLKPGCSLFADTWELVVAEGAKGKSIHWDFLLPNGTFLTDPDNANLLRGVQLVCYYLREDEFARIDESITQYYRAQKLLTLVSWMVLNKVRSFDSLTMSHLDDFLDDIPYGRAGLLQLDLRIECYLAGLRAQKNYQPPVLSDGTLAVEEFLEAGGFYRGLARNDLPMLWQVANFEFELGMKINSQRQARWFEELPDKTLAMVEPPERKIQGWREIQDLLVPWLNLWELRKYCTEDALQFQPFVSLRAITRTAKKLSKKKEGRTGTIPEKQAAWLIDRALRWVLLYSEDLFALKAIYDSIPALKNGNNDLSSLRSAFEGYELRHTGPANPWPLVPSFQPSQEEDRDVVTKSFFDALYGFLPTACAIVISAFTARRHNEVLTIKSGCISWDETGAWIETYIEKTLRDWDKTPCPRVVVKAVEVLEQLSLDAREKSGEPFLFRFNWRSDESSRLNLGKRLKEFAHFIEVPPLEDGTCWDFKPHQFRRFFSMLYMWRFNDLSKSLEALRHHLRHASLERTMRYVTESTPGEAFQKASREQTSKILAEQATGRKHAIGEFAKRFKKTMDRVKSLVRKNLTVITARNVRKRVEMYIDKHNTRLVPLPWGYCAVESEDSLTTVCCLKSTDQAVLRLSHSDPTECAGCERFMVDDEHRDYWLMKARAYESASKNANNPALMRGFMKSRADKFKSAINFLWPGGADVTSK